jgi:hypothetical protein
MALVFYHCAGRYLGNAWASTATGRPVDALEPDTGLPRTVISSAPESGPFSGGFADAASGLQPKDGDATAACRQPVVAPTGVDLLRQPVEAGVVVGVGQPSAGESWLR